MGPLGLVEVQGVGDAVDDAVGDAGGVAALEPGVVLARDACEEGDLLAAQARDPSAVAAVGGQPGLGGADLGSSRAQELPNLGADLATEVARVSRSSFVSAMPSTLRALPHGWGSLPVPLSSGSPTSPQRLV
jgi:hypothetical protein